MLLAVCLAFVAMGVVIAVLGNWRLGVGDAVLFGLGALVFANQLFESRRLTHPLREDERRELPKGHPFGPSRRRQALVVALLVLAGGAQCLIGWERNPVFFWLGVAFVVGAVAVGVLVALGRFSRRTVTFEADGVRLAWAEGACLVRYDNLAELSTVTINGTLLVGLRPIELGGVLATAPEGQRTALTAKMHQAMLSVGVPLFINPAFHGFDARVLLWSLERWVRAARGA